MRATSSHLLAVENPETMFAITVSDVVVGGIGVKLRDDVERGSAEVGYWLGEPYWGRGITTRALAAFTRFAFTAYDLERLYAVPFAVNPASCRVLQKAGYRLEDACAGAPSRTAKCRTSSCTPSCVEMER